MPSRLAPGFFMSSEAPKEVINARIYLIALVASMGGFIFGYDLAFIGTTITLAPFTNDFGLTNASVATTNAFSANIVSLLQAGCFFGSLAVGPLGDRFGRKIALIVAGVTFCIGSLMQTASHGIVALMFLGRAIGGLGVGLASGLVPLYVAELSPPKARGRLVGIYEISVQLGTCTGFWICFGVSKTMAATSAQWVTPFAVQLIPGGLLIFGMFFVPESPRWLARYKSRTIATEVLSRLRNIPEEHPYLQEEMQYIMNSVEEELLYHPNRGFLGHLKELVSSPSNRKRILLGLMVFTFMQWAGSNAINYYSPRIFESIGLTGTSTSLYATGIYGIVRLVCVIIAMYYVVDRFGRKKMLIGGAVIMLIAMWAVGAFIKIANPAANTSGQMGSGSYAAIVFIYVFAVGFCFSYAGVPWIYCSEIFPAPIRGIGMAICTAWHWLLNFALARSVPYMISGIGYGTYFVFASCITFSIPCVYFLLPETKGLSLEEVGVLFGESGFGAEVDADLENAKPSTGHYESRVEHEHKEKS